jgi:hypothetical protein
VLQEFLSLGDGSTKHRIFIHYNGWSGDRWDSWVDARCRCAARDLRDPTFTALV